MPDKPQVDPAAVAEVTGNYYKNRAKAAVESAKNPLKAQSSPVESAYDAYVTTSKDRAYRGDDKDREGSWLTPAWNNVKQWGKDVFQGIRHVTPKDYIKQLRSNTSAVYNTANNAVQSMKKPLQETWQGLRATTGKEWENYFNDSLLQFSQAATGAINDTVDFGRMLGVPGAAKLQSYTNRLHRHMIDDYQYSDPRNKSDTIRYITQGALGLVGPGGIAKGITKAGLHGVKQLAKQGIRHGGKLRKLVNGTHRGTKAAYKVNKKIAPVTKTVGITGTLAPAVDKVTGFTGANTETDKAIQNLVPYMSLANLRSPAAFMRSLKLQQLPDMRGYGKDLRALVQGNAEQKLSVLRNIAADGGNSRGGGLGSYITNQVLADLRSPGNHLTQRALGMINTMPSFSSMILRPRLNRRRGENIVETFAYDNDIPIDKVKRSLILASRAYNTAGKFKRGYDILHDMTRDNERVN